MRTVWIVGFSMFVLAPAVFAGDGPSNGPQAKSQTKATIQVVDAGWKTQTATNDCVTGLGNDTWELKLSKTKELRITVTDLLCPGDFFEIFVDGRLLGTTPNLSPPWGCFTGGAGGPNSSGQVRVVLVPGTHRIRVRDAGFDHHSAEEISRESFCPAGFVVMGHLFDPVGLSIVQPAEKQDFDLSEGTLTATPPVTFEARGADATVNWKADLAYQTSGGRGSTTTKPYHMVRSFQTRIADPHTETYQGLGGLVSVTATSKAGGQSFSASKMFTITGIEIPETKITQRLVNLYGIGATRRLMTGLASQESTYRQFSQSTLYGRTDLWPTESYDGGSHIGLMQMPTTENLSYAWSWLVNTEAGVKLFGDKLASAGRIMKAIIKKHPGLRELTAVELENMALVLYGPGASGDQAEQYYIPSRSGGAWVWVRNALGNPEGVSYADSVRSKIKP